VDLALELKNTGDKDIQIWISGDPTMIDLKLDGPGAVSVAPRRAFTQEFRIPKAVSLAPGKTYSMEIKSLSFGFRNQSQFAYWTEPGDYTLTASFKTAVSPTPKGAKETGEKGFGQVTVTSAPVKIMVTEK
jgi:hypothetical protein